jgi:hypothetical protein
MGEGNRLFNTGLSLHRLDQKVEAIELAKKSSYYIRANRKPHAKVVIEQIQKVAGIIHQITLLQYPQISNPFYSPPNLFSPK